MANVTTVTAANLIPELWGPLVLRSYVAAQKFRPLVRALEVEGGYGDTIHIPVITALAAVDKTANVDLTPVSNTEAKVDVALNIHKAQAVSIEDIAAVQSKFDLLSIYAEEIGGALGRAVDSSIANLAPSCSASVDATATTTANMHSKIIEAKLTLDAANAPEAGRVLAVTPSFAAQLISNAYFASKDYRGDAAAVSDGVVGSIYGFDVVMSNALPSGGGTDTNFAFVKSAVGLAVQKDISLRAQDNALGLATEVVGDVIYGCGILTQDGCLKLTSSTTPYVG